MQAIRDLIDTAYDSGWNSAKGYTDSAISAAVIAKRNSQRDNIEEQLESLRLIIRNAQSELPKKNWLQRDLKAAELWLDGTMDIINSLDPKTR